MKHKQRYNSRGKPIFEKDFIEGTGWCADLARGRTGELLLVKYQDGSHDDPEATNALDCESYEACPPEDDEITRHICLAPADGCRGEPPSTDVLLDRIERFLSCCLDLDGSYLFLLACFVISTWLVDRLPVAPYISLVGLPRSGKTTALHALYLICRRGMITTDVSSAGFYRACDRLTPTLCIDEAAAAGQKQTLLYFLRSGTTRHTLAFRQGRSCRTYGAKVVAWTQMPDDDALNSRCITIPMEESSRRLLRTTDPVILAKAAMLQTNLHMFRMRNYWRPELRQIPATEPLCSRDRDLYEALALPISTNVKACEHLLNFFADEENRHREPLPPDQTAVLEGFFKQIHAHPDQNAYALGQLKKEVDHALAESGERFRLNERAISGLLRTFGFLRRKRTNAGCVVLIDRHTRKRLHDLFSLYGMNSPAQCLSSQSISSQCEFCTPRASESPEMAAPSEVTSYEDLYRRIEKDTDWTNATLWEPDSHHEEQFDDPYPSLTVRDVLPPELLKEHEQQEPFPSESNNDEHDAPGEHTGASESTLDLPEGSPLPSQSNNGEHRERSERNNGPGSNIAEGEQASQPLSESNKGERGEPSEPKDGRDSHLTGREQAATASTDASPASKDFGKTAYMTCPNCGEESYVMEEDRCTSCDVRADGTCARCGNEIPPEELDSAPLCGWCEHMMRKDD